MSFVALAVSVTAVVVEKSKLKSAGARSAHADPVISILSSSESGITCIMLTSKWKSAEDTSISGAISEADTVAVLASDVTC